MNYKFVIIFSKETDRCSRFDLRCDYLSKIFDLNFILNF